VQKLLCLKKQEGQMQQKLIVCDPDKCLGCLICEFACSAHKEKGTDPSLSRIRVVNFEPTGSMAIACVLCDDTPCVRVCPRKALRQNEETGTIIVDESKCNACGWCFGACPFGAIAFNPTRKKVMICDLCDGEPECVKYCPFEGALTYTTVDEVGHKYRRGVFKKLLEDKASEM
jgi:carbon-monoxide dehydrogenase iron sulfur subunit